MTNEQPTTTGSPGEVGCPWCGQIVDDDVDFFPGEVFTCRHCRKLVEIARVKLDVTLSLIRA